MKPLKIFGAALVLVASLSVVARADGGIIQTPNALPPPSTPTTSMVSTSESTDLFTTSADSSITAELMTLLAWLYIPAF